MRYDDICLAETDFHRNTHHIGEARQSRGSKWPCFPHVWCNRISLRHVS